MPEQCSARDIKNWRRCTNPVKYRIAFEATPRTSYPYCEYHQKVVLGAFRAFVVAEKKER